MDNAELIKQCEEMLNAGAPPSALALGYLLRRVIPALRRAKPSEKPFTLDELRQMDGEPVWIECIAEPGMGGNWAIAKHFKGGHDDGILLYDAICKEHFAAFCLYGDSWLAYRRKPERSEG